MAPDQNRASLLLAEDTGEEHASSRICCQLRKSRSNPFIDAARRRAQELPSLPAGLLGHPVATGRRSAVRRSRNEKEIPKFSAHSLPVSALPVLCPGSSRSAVSPAEAAMPGAFIVPRLHLQSLVTKADTYKPRVTVAGSTLKSWEEGTTSSSKSICTEDGLSKKVPHVLLPDITFSSRSSGSAVASLPSLRTPVANPFLGTGEPSGFGDVTDADEILATGTLLQSLCNGKRGEDVEYGPMSRLVGLTTQELDNLCDVAYSRTDYIATEVVVRDEKLVIKHLADQQISNYGVGGNLWGPALVLSRFLGSLERPSGKYLTGKRVLELGSGTGTVGLAAATLGAMVTLSDLEKVLPLMACNVLGNLPTVAGTSIAMLDWAQASRWPLGSLPHFDIVLCSDVIYWTDPIEDLALLMAALLNNGRTTLLWAWVKRHEHVGRELWRAFAANGIVVARLPIEADALQPDGNVHVSRHVEAYVACARGGQLDPVIAAPASNGFVFGEDGSVKGVRSHATPHH